MYADYRKKTNLISDGGFALIDRFDNYFLEKITGTDTARIDRSKWTKVNKRVNEMGFPGEYVNLSEQ